MLSQVGTQRIETRRLMLRRLTPEDADAMYHNFASDAEVSRFMRWTPYQSVEETKRDLTEIAASYASDRTYRWGVCLRDGTLIGTVGVGGMDERDERAEIAYCLGRAYWGQGYAAEAVRAVFELMFSSVGLNRIEAYHAVGNPASGRVMQKAGMTLEGHARQKFHTREGFQDCELYGITREEWETQKQIEVYNALPVIFEGFLELPRLADGEIELVCTGKMPAIPEKKWVSAYAFEVRKDGMRIGEINLRVGYTASLYYGGQIGYNIDEAYRGNGYAGRACRLLAPVLWGHGMTKALITNDRNNLASKRVCEKLGAVLIRVARLPQWHDLYHEGIRFVNVFEWTVPPIGDVGHIGSF